MYFGYCYGGGNYICYVEPIVDRGPGSPTARYRRRRLPPFTGGGLLRWQVESVSWACILDESRRVSSVR